jgi:SAM-dependent methyltransferase
MAFERIAPATPEWDAYYANHIQRYAFAARILQRESPPRVLDVACGVGYGAHYLATHEITDVTAVDYDQAALELGQKNFAHPAIRYVQDDCHSLTNASPHGPFDAVVSFETLEHLKQPEKFLQAVRHCMRASGSLIISTPNANVSGGTADWKFHHQEFSAVEFEELLRAADFSDVALFGQRKTSFGRLRDDLRAELNLLRSNPFFRLGRILQRLRHPGYERLTAPLPERAEDFEITPIHNAETCDAEGTAGPFVIVAVARGES